MYKHRPLCIYWRVEWVWNLVFNRTRECGVEQKCCGYGCKGEEGVGSWEGGWGDYVVTEWEILLLAAPVTYHINVLILC
jgi:hypothetical protein